MSADRLDRFRGLMVGTAVGDCLGRPVEGHRDVPVEYLEELTSKPPPLIYSDDTIMTILVAESLLESDGFDGEDMAMRFAEEFNAEPHRGYGRGVVEVFSRVLRGEPWDRAARRQFDGSGSYGNGAAMRVAPVALWPHESLFELAWLAQDTARVTHTHPVGMEGAVIQAIAADFALCADGGTDASELLETLDRFTRTEEFRAKLELLAECQQRADDEFARLQLGTSVRADGSVVTALYCFLLAESFEAAVLRAIGLGGDTDTIGAMSGALAGARFGLRGIPGQWQGVEGYGRLVDLADRMFQRAVAL
jgi:poly(ADP-ribose) glycohydrolase ARH3